MEMVSRVLESAVRHKIGFDFRTQDGTIRLREPSIVVSSREVRLLVVEIPASTMGLTFADFIETRVVVGNEEHTINSSLFNFHCYTVMWKREEAEELVNKHGHTEVEVPPHLKNKVWVLESPPRKSL